MVFAANHGQWPDDLRYLARLGGAELWVTDNSLVFDFTGGNDERPAVGEWDDVDGESAATRRGHVVRMRFEGALADRVSGRGLQSSYHNYFLGDDPARWAARVPLYDEVVLEGLTRESICACTTTAGCRATTSSLPRARIWARYGCDSKALTG